MIQSASMSFAYPGALLLPLLAGFLLLRGSLTRSTAPFPSASLASGVPLGLRARLRAPILLALGFISFCALSVAAARPQRITVIENEKERRNVVLALDISRSMATRDFGSGFRSISRIAGVKEVVEDYIRERPEDRIGLVVFGGNAFVQAPLTRDHSLVEKLVSALNEGLAGDGTAIGDGLGVSLKRIQDVQANSRAIILLTDGANNAGQVHPLQAARVAADMGVKIHTIGIGSSHSEGFFGAQPGAEFDEATLREIARITGGLYQNASDAEGLRKVYEEIDRLDTSALNDSSDTVIEELFAPFAWASLAAFLAWLILRATIFVKLP